MIGVYTSDEILSVELKEGIVEVTVAADDDLPGSDPYVFGYTVDAALKLRSAFDGVFASEQLL